MLMTETPKSDVNWAVPGVHKILFVILLQTGAGVQWRVCSQISSIYEGIYMLFNTDNVILTCHHHWVKMFSECSVNWLPWREHYCCKWQDSLNYSPISGLSGDMSMLSAKQHTHTLLVLYYTWHYYNSTQSPQHTCNAWDKALETRGSKALKLIWNWCYFLFCTLLCA